MHLKFIYSALILAAMVALAAWNAVDTTVSTNSNTKVKPSIGPETTYADGARRITTDELETLMKEGKVFLVDVRLEDAYNVAHIPGATLIPAGDILKHLDQFPRDKMIVTYCS